MIVLPNRRCGRPKPGLYLISRKSTQGTLAPFTALAAPLPAAIANPRRPQVVDTARTLAGVAGLVNYDEAAAIGRFARLPVRGVADFWGQSQGYKSVWDVIEETKRLGVCRRVAQVFDIALPCPVLMLHAEAVVGVPDLIGVARWLHEYGIEWLSDCVQEDGQMVAFEDQPWREANSLGRKGDDTYDWHSYVKLWEVIPQLRKRRLFKKFREECGVRFEQGGFGFGWITDFAMVLQDDQDEVPAHLAAKGVIPALVEGQNGV